MPARNLMKHLDDPEPMTRWSESRVLRVIDTAQALLEPQPALIRVDRGPVTFVGDTHGDFAATVKAGRLLLEGRTRHLVFLGDYVDRGERQIVNLLLALLLKIRRPKRVFLLRGNHETLDVNTRLGFLDAVEARYSTDLHARFNDLFAQLSLALVTRDGVLALHGGVPEGLAELSRLEGFTKGWTDEESRIKGELLWNDPEDGLEGFAPNTDREGYCLFGQDAFDRFMDRNGLRLMVRSHECFPEGHRYFFDGWLLSIFSKAGYEGDNKGVVAVVRGKEVEILDI